jgi:hypothetical protein
MPPGINVGQVLKLQLMPLGFVMVLQWGRADVAAAEPQAAQHGRLMRPETRSGAANPSNVMLTASPP